MTVPASTSITTQVTTHMATPEYEVESILKAKVFMRGKKMGWKFYVKWKGYEDADNTWEPFKSFEDSGEGIVDRFWERVDTKGRDVDSIEGWTNGEEVFPTGPPRRRGRPPLKKDKPTLAAERPSKGTTNDAKRPLQSPEPETPSKRKRVGTSRGRTGVRSTQKVRRVSHTPVPDSQSEGEQMLVEPSSSPKLAPNDTLVHDGLASLANPDVQSAPPQSRKRGRPRRLQEPTAPQTRAGRTGPRARKAPPPTADNKERNSRPRRGRRKTNGEDTTQDTEEVLELLESASAPVDSVVFRSGSSGAEIPLQDKPSIPTEAGSTKSANHTGADSPILPNHDEIRPSPFNTTFELPDKRPTSISFPGPSSGSSNPWKRATIFGPLAIGAGLATWVTATATETGLSSTSVPKPFPLSLDNSTTVPVTLKDVALAQTAHTPRLENIVSGTHGPPGKLYKSHAAAALLETLETGGSCARLVLDETATAEQRRVFDAFRSKLEEGGLFVVMASSEILACCSSTNEDHTKKLALTPSLEGLSETVVVSHVKVVNYSAFADAAALAENVRW
ncbi:hypothetical protein EDB92DRAFT_1825230 [Lactarius akahatsu]|uniref:Chromo domain-containing protein n=1 Tax=Lactarius akahatsu TaxID=416441 RepID=A0AAD4QI15_9AGAM|nr:hypothetical protein EDB92DRAFT_1825230 [Lactarius akahatsu]